MNCTCHRDANAWRTCPHEPHRTDPANLARVSGIEGVPVYVSNGAIGYGDPPGRDATDDDHMRYVLLSKTVAAALVAVAEAAREWMRSGPKTGPERLDALHAALAALTEAQAGAA